MGGEERGGYWEIYIESPEVPESFVSLDLDNRLINCDKTYKYRLYRSYEN